MSQMFTTTFYFWSSLTTAHTNQKSDIYPINCANKIMWLTCDMKHVFWSVLGMNQVKTSVKSYRGKFNTTSKKNHYRNIVHTFSKRPPYSFFLTQIICTINEERRLSVTNFSFFIYENWEATEICTIILYSHNHSAGLGILADDVMVMSCNEGWTSMDHGIELHAVLLNHPTSRLAHFNLSFLVMIKTQDRSILGMRPANLHF